MKVLKNIFPILLLTLIPTLIIWGIFYFKIPEINSIPLPQNGMETVVANYDGPLYLVVAKTLYNNDAIKTSFQFPLPVEYYAAHFPLFPVLIRLVALVTKTFPYSMLIVTLFSSFLALFFFHKLISQYVDKDIDALWLTLVFAIFPARWLVVRSIGSPEPLFIAALIASVYYFDKKKFWLAGIWGAIATLTKSPGILLFIAYLGAVIIPRLKSLATSKFDVWLKSLNLKRYPVILIPIALLIVFYIYKIQFNNFFAYFNSGDNIHLMFPPFQIFNYSAPWVGTFWLEEIIFVYLLGALGLMELIRLRKWTLACFVGIFFTSILFVAHRDLMRYALPIVPFLFVAFSKYMVTKQFKIAFIILIIPTFLFALAFISGNVMPIANWGPLL
jgi:Gpi18-like mannosyltransferase